MSILLLCQINTRLPYIVLECLWTHIHNTLRLNHSNLLYMMDENDQCKSRFVAYEYIVIELPSSSNHQHGLSALWKGDISFRKKLIVTSNHTNHRWWYMTWAQITYVGFGIHSWMSFFSFLGCEWNQASYFGMSEALVLNFLTTYGNSYWNNFLCKLCNTNW